MTASAWPSSLQPEEGEVCVHCSLSLMPSARADVKFSYEAGPLSLQINMQNLKDRDSWASGWLQKSEVEAMEEPGGTCQVCAGTGHMVCPLCKDGPVVII